MADYVTATQFDKRMGKVEKQLEEHHKTLFGNGVPGWDEMLRTLYADYLERKEAEKEQRKAEAKVDKETVLQKIKGSWEFKIAVINGGFLLILAIFDYILHLGGG